MHVYIIQHAAEFGARKVVLLPQIGCIHILLEEVHREKFRLIRVLSEAFFLISLNYDNIYVHRQF